MGKLSQCMDTVSHDMQDYEWHSSSLTCSMHVMYITTVLFCMCSLCAILECINLAVRIYHDISCCCMYMYINSSSHKGDINYSIVDLK